MRGGVGGLPVKTVLDGRRTRHPDMTQPLCEGEGHVRETQVA